MHFIYIHRHGQTDTQTHTLHLAQLITLTQMKECVSVDDLTTLFETQSQGPVLQQPPTL